MNILASVEEWVKKNFQWISGGLRKLRDLKEVAMSIKPMIELAKKKSLGGVCPIKDFFLILRGTETSSALRYLVSKL